MDSTSEKEDIEKIDAILKNHQNDYIDEVLYDDFIVYDDSSSEKISDEDEVDGYNFEIPELIDIKSIYKYDPLASLRPEEKLIIDSCHDLDLKKVLVLNRTRRLHLIKLYKKIKDLLIECKQNIIEKYEVVKAGKSMNLQHVYSKCWRLAAPYFKDKQYFLSPPNTDTLRKKVDNELSAYDFVMSPKWSRAECDKLIASVTFNYNLNQQMAIKKNIAMVTRNGTINRENEQVRELQKQLKLLESNENELPPLNNDEHIDWHKVSGKFLKDKYSTFECRSFWHTYLHPKVNKGAWSLREDSKLKELVAKYGFRNWTKIAESLGTRRTCLQVCMHYFRDLHKHIKVGTFTMDEDNLLLSLIEKYRMGNHIPWAKIVKHFKNRKRTQIYQRYINYLCRNDRKRGKFSQAEDAMIMICVDKYGVNYKKCVKHLPLRSAVQIKMRYRNNCQVLLKRGEYSLLEDMRIMEYVKQYGTKNWGPLANELNRSTGLLRQRYLTVTNFLDRHQDKTIKDVQRRKTKIDKVEAERYQLARSIADKYKDQPIPSLEQLEEEIGYLRSLETVSLNTLSDKDVNGTKSEEDTEEERIDWKLVEFFTYSSLENEEDSCDEKVHDLNSTVREVETALNSLQSKLNIQSGFAKNRFLDTIDLDILYEYKRHLRNLEQSSFIRQSTQKLVPPNLNTCLALKCLLINHAKHKQYSRPKMNLSDCLDTYSSKEELTVYLNKFDESRRKTILSQLNSFYHRFYKLLKWPAMLSSMHPNSGLLYSSQNMPMQCIARRREKHYIKQYQTAASLSSTNDPKIFGNQMDEIDCSEYRIDPQQCPKGSTCDENCTVTEDISGKTTGSQRSQLSIRIIRSAKKGTEVIQVLPNTWKGITDVLKENKKIRTEITANSAVKQYANKTHAINDNSLQHRCVQLKNECVANCTDEEYSQNVQKRLDHSSQYQSTITFRQYIQNISRLSSENSNFKAQPPFSFVNIKSEIADSHGDIQLSQTTDSRNIRVKTESVDNSINEQCPEESPEMLSKTYPSINDSTNIEVLDSTREPQSIRRYVNTENSVKSIICDGLNKSSNRHITKPIIGPLKLVPVTNKSVINGLLKDKSKKLFVLSSPPKKGQEGTFIKEIKLNRTESGSLVAPRISPLQISSGTLSVSTECMDDTIVSECEMESLEQNQRNEDENLLLDIHKLDSILG